MLTTTERMKCELRGRLNSLDMILAAQPNWLSAAEQHQYDGERRAYAEMISRLEQLEPA